MIYIHIPFCRTFCTYCGFYSELAGKDGVSLEMFAGALANEYALRKEDAAGGTATLYIGGGTPSVLPLSVLSRIIRSVTDDAGTDGLREFTVEVNPDDILRGGPEYAGALLSAGVDRISMGVQSFDDGLLKWMNRRHTSGDAERAYGILRQAGFRNISLDLIFGISQMSDAIWNETLDRILSLPGGLPEHISAYQLSVEPGSALDRMVARGRYSEADEGQCGRQYEMLCDRMGRAGYRHYEVSNFAIPGHEAVHNSAYWSGSPYLGLGPGAHSYLTDGKRHVRCWNRQSVKKYVDVYSSIENGRARQGEILETEELSAGQTAMERIMLSLRTDCGIPEAELRNIGNPHGVDRMLLSGNLVRIQEGRVRIPENRFFISDAVISDLV